MTMVFGKSDTEKEKIAKDFLTNDTVTMGERLYFMLRYEKPTTLSKLELKVTAQTTEMPLSLVLSMLLPMIQNSVSPKEACSPKNKHRERWFEEACSATVQLKKLLAHEADSNVYISRVSDIQKWVKGSIDDLLGVIRHEIRSKSCPIPVKDMSHLKIPPQIYTNLNYMVTSAASQVCTQFESMSDLMLWLCVSNAALSGVIDYNNKCIRTELIKDLIRKTYNPLKSECQNGLLENTLCLYVSRPSGSDGWVQSFCDLITKFALNLPVGEVIAVKVQIHEFLSKSPSNEFKCSVEDLNAFIHPFITTYIPNIGLGEALFSTWWSQMRDKVPPSGSVLAELFNSYPETHHKWLSIIGEALIKDGLFDWGYTNLSTTAFADRVAVIFDAEVFGQSESNITRALLSKKVLSESWKIPRFLSLIKHEQVIQQIQSNQTVINFLKSYLLPNLKNIQKSYYMANSELLFLDNYTLFGLFSTNAFEILHAEAVRNPNRGLDLFQNLFVTAYASNTVPLGTDWLPLKFPDYNYAQVVTFTKFSFFGDKKLIVMNQSGSFEWTLIGWIWLSMLNAALPDSHMKRPEFVNLIDELATQAIHGANMHNALKLILLLNTFLSKSQKPSSNQNRKQATEIEDSKARLSHILMNVVDHVFAKKLGDEASLFFSSEYSHSFLPFNNKIKIVIEDMKDKLNVMEHIGEEEKFPQCLVSLSREQFDDYLIEWISKGVAISEEGRQCLVALQNWFEKVNEKMTAIKVNIIQLCRIVTWITDVRKETLESCEHEMLKANRVVKNPFHNMAEALKTIEHQSSSENPSLISLQKDQENHGRLIQAITHTLSPDQKSLIDTLLFDPIRHEHHHCALLNGFFCQKLSSGLFEDVSDALKSALDDALANYLTYPHDEQQDYRFIPSTVDIESELQLLKKFCESRKQPIEESLNRVKNTLSAIRLKGTIDCAKRLLGAEGLPCVKYDADEWAIAVRDVLMDSELVNAHTLRDWKAVSSISSGIPVLREVIKILNLTIHPNSTAKSIKEEYNLKLMKNISGTLKCMSGLVGESDSSYDVLAAFQHYVPLLVAVLLTSDNKNFTLSTRLEFICRVERMAATATSVETINMLNANIYEVPSIVQIQGSTSVIGRMKSELNRIQEDKLACIAVRVCADIFSKVPSSDEYFSNENRQMITIQLYLTKNEVLAGSRSDDDLAEFVEFTEIIQRDSTITENTPQVFFSHAWNIMNDLIPHLKCALWFGLKEDTVKLTTDQASLIEKLPKLSGEFYVACISIKQRDVPQITDILSQITAFIEKQKEIHLRENWTLVFPKVTSNCIIRAIEDNSSALSNQTIAETRPILYALGIRRDIDFSGISVASLKTLVLESSGYTKALKYIKGSQRKIEILPYRCSYENNKNAKSPDLLLGEHPSSTYTRLFFGQALRFALHRHKWTPLPFELFWCSTNTTENDIDRLLQAMALFEGGRFTIIGEDTLAPGISQKLLEGIQRLTNEHKVPNTLILTAADELALGKTQDVLLSSTLLKEVDLQNTKIPSHTPAAQGTPRQTPLCTFITGDFLSGKSHYALKQEAQPLPHTGDALDTMLAIQFFKRFDFAAERKQKTIWIDLNSYMISNTPKDPQRLQKLNHFLFMLLTFRIIIDEESGAVATIPDAVHFLIEVPKHMMFLDKSSPLPGWVSEDPTLHVASCSHLGTVFKVPSKLESFDITEKHAKVSVVLEMILKSGLNGANVSGWNLAQAAKFACDTATDVGRKERDTKVRAVLSECFSQGILPTHYMLKDKKTVACNGSLAILLQLLYSRFKPFFESESSSLAVEIWANKHKNGFLCALKDIVRQTCVRCAPDCEITHEQLVMQEKEPIFLPSSDVFITYPISKSHQNADVEKLSGGSKKTRKNVLDDPGRPTTTTACDIDLSYVLTGHGNVTDMIDFQKVFEEVGFVTVDDMLIRALHCVERQQSRIPLIVSGATGVGKSYLISLMFRIQLQYAIRAATNIVTRFLWHERIESDRKKDATSLLNKYKMAKGKTKKDGTLPDFWDEKIIEAVYGSNDQILDHVEKIFKDDKVKDPAGFFRRFEVMKKKLNEEAPVLVWPREVPPCFVTKTFDDPEALIKYFKTLLSSHVEYEYKIVAHPDTKREDLVKLLRKPMALAKALRQSKDPRINGLVVPVFIDEPNTLIETAGLVKTLMSDRRNPFCTDRLDNDDLGIWLVGAINRQSANYRTQALHPSLELVVSYFAGVAGADQRRSYIEEILKRCADFLTEERFLPLKKQLVDIVLKMHEKSESLCKPIREGVATPCSHVVSQREFHKVDAIIHTIYRLIDDKVVTQKGPKERDELLVCACITAVYYTYVARIRSEKIRREIKSFMEELCKDQSKEIAKVYFPGFKDSIVSNARRQIVDEVATTETFKLGSGVALTDTLRENIFLTLLACVSDGKHKLSLAIIGDSGMGKTLSSRVVERNVKGPNSETKFCQRLLQTRFYYIQGATTTTSEQVSRVCERALKGQEKENRIRSVVSFDEGSLPESERMVQKSLHEPVDRKIISIIVLSNKPFDDEANQNRFLVVWNESLSVKELTAGCLEYETFNREPSQICPFRPVIVALTNSYFALRESDDPRSKVLQTRDYIYLLKFLAERTRKGQIFGPLDLKCGLEMNYGTSSQGFIKEVITLFFGNMNKILPNWSSLVPDPLPVEKILQLSYARYKQTQQLRLRPRFKILIDPSDTNCLATAALHAMKQVMTEHNNPDLKVVYITVSEHEGDRKRTFETKILSQLRIAMEEGAHVVIRNPERLLSYLFDVLNLNYTRFTNKDGVIIERAIVALGATTALFDVHENFLITFVFNISEIKKLEINNIPFLSRCEKYLLRIDFDAAFCQPVVRFVEDFVGIHNIHMFHPKLTVNSAVTSTSSHGGHKVTYMDPEHIFQANCKILSLVPVATFLRLFPKLARKAEYASSYLENSNYSLDAVIASATTGTCTMVCTQEKISSDEINNSVDSNTNIICVDKCRSFDHLTASIEILDDRTDISSIVVLVSSQQASNSHFMWALCNEVSQRSQQGNRHPFIIVAGAPCNVTAVFSDQWRYVLLNTCTMSLIARKLLRSIATIPDEDITKREITKN